MKDLTDMRCGDGMLSTPECDPMTPACSTHDLDYIYGGTDEERIAADENFRKNCEFIAQERGTLFAWIQCWLYPAVVRLFSKDFWKPYSREDDYFEQGRK